MLLALTFQQLGDVADQRVGALSAETLVEPGQVVQAQQQQVAGGVLFAGRELRVQPCVEQATVGQAGKAVLVGLLAQFLAAAGFLGEQGLELVDHLVHRLYHAPQLRGARFPGQGEEFAAGDGVGLLHHLVQRLQLGAQQPATKDGADQPAGQQPGEAAQRAVPQLGQGELRMADHLDPRGLFPAAHDQRVAALGLEVDQLGEPGRHLLVLRVAVALDDDLASGMLTTRMVAK